VAGDASHPSASAIASARRWLAIIDVRRRNCRALRVGGGAAQVVEIAYSRLRIARLEPLLVGDRLLLDEFDRDRARCRS
jgi:hypothetical protein